MVTRSAHVTAVGREVRGGSKRVEGESEPILPQTSTDCEHTPPILYNTNFPRFCHAPRTGTPLASPLILSICTSCHMKLLWPCCAHTTKSAACMDCANSMPHLKHGAGATKISLDTAFCALTLPHHAPQEDKTEHLPSLIHQQHAFVSLHRARTRPRPEPRRRPRGRLNQGIGSHAREPSEGTAAAHIGSL